MSYFGKVYTLVKNEKFDDWLRSSGVPEDKVKAIDGSKPTQKYVKNADGTYTSTTTTNGAVKNTTFTSGVEFDDTIGDENLPIRSTYTVDGNTITQVIKSKDGTAVFKKEFNGDDMIVTITSDKFDGVAKRYYKA